MWNADFEWRTLRSDPPEVEPRPEPEPHLPKTNLQAIVSILAIGVLRRRARKGTVKLSGILGFWRRKRSAVECRIHNLGSGRGAD